MTNSPDGGTNPSGTAPPSGPGTPPAAGGTPEIDPVAVMRSRAYLSALVLAALLGIPISIVAYGFLALVSKIQVYVFDDLPHQLLDGGVPA